MDRKLEIQQRSQLQACESYQKLAKLDWPQQQFQPMMNLGAPDTQYELSISTIRFEFGGGYFIFGFLCLIFSIQISCRFVGRTLKC